MGAKWDELKKEFAEEKAKQQEKDRIKAEKKAEKERNMSETDKVVKEAYGIAKIMFVGKYAFSLIFGLMFFFFLGWFLIDMAWQWFVGLF